LRRRGARTFRLGWTRFGGDGHSWATFSVHRTWPGSTGRIPQPRQSWMRWRAHTEIRTHSKSCMPGVIRRATRSRRAC